MSYAGKKNCLVLTHSFSLLLLSDGLDVLHQHQLLFVIMNHNRCKVRVKLLSTTELCLKLFLVFQLAHEVQEAHFLFDFQSHVVNLTSYKVGLAEAGEDLFEPNLLSRFVFEEMRLVLLLLDNALRRRHCLEGSDSLQYSFISKFDLSQIFVKHNNARRYLVHHSDQTSLALAQFLEGLEQLTIKLVFEAEDLRECNEDHCKKKKNFYLSFLKINDLVESEAIIKPKESIVQSANLPR